MACLDKNKALGTGVVSDQSVRLPMVFTDLDGTFLDHHSYRYEAALPAVQALKARGGKLFAVSSKTLAEQKDLFDSTKIFDGYVAENGGVIHVDDNTVVLGPSAAQIASAKRAIEARWGKPVPSFQPVFLREVMASTGLPEPSAKLACQRLCSDPLIFLDEPKPSAEELAAFAVLAKQYGTNLVHGGRFATLCGLVGKADAMLDIVSRWQAKGFSPVTLALGDSANDIDMLKAAHGGVYIPNPDGYAVDKAQLSGLTMAVDHGPRGWNAAVMQWLHSLDS